MMATLRPRTPQQSADTPNNARTTKQPKDRNLGRPNGRSAHNRTFERPNDPGAAPCQTLCPHQPVPAPLASLLAQSSRMLVRSGQRDWSVIQSSPSVNIYLITGLLLQYHKPRASIRRVRKAEPGRVGTIHVQTKVAETKHNVASKWDHFLQNEEDFHVRHISFIFAPQLRRIVELFPLQVFPRGELCWLQ